MFPYMVQYTLPFRAPKIVPEIILYSIKRASDQRASATQGYSRSCRVRVPAAGPGPGPGPMGPGPGPLHITWFILDEAYYVHFSVCNPLEHGRGEGIQACAISSTTSQDRLTQAHFTQHPHSTPYSSQDRLTQANYLGSLEWRTLFDRTLFNRI